jgi:gamma-glutamyltranspeptidase/glutathione hydrolase
MMVNENSKEFRFGAAASGGVTAPTALVQSALAAMAGGMPVDAALALPRVHHSGAPDLLYYEPAIGRTVLDSLLARGYSIAPSRSLGLVNAIYCPLGLPVKPESCSVANDPRGFGLAVSADR